MEMKTVAVSVLTGFLGAGKTTLLNRLLRDPQLAHTAVIINEFGDVSIDHLLVEKANDDVIELSDGCVCCTVRGELVDTLADLLDRVQTGRLQRLDRIVIETTGLADPVPVLQSIIGHPVLVQELRLDGVITVVDALHGHATLDAHEEAVRQASVADRIVLSKQDLATEDALADLMARLKTLNPSARIVDAGTEVVRNLFDVGLWDPKSKSADVQRWLGEDGSHGHHHHQHDDACGHDHDHHDDHQHHHHHGPHDRRVSSFSLVHDRPIPWTSIEMFLDLLRSTQGPRMLRMKGIVDVAEDPDRPLVLHGVQGTMHPPSWLPRWPDTARETRLVIIGFDLDQAYVERLFAGFVGRPTIDGADRQAISDNPLAVAGFRAPSAV